MGSQPFCSIWEQVLGTVSPLQTIFVLLQAIKVDMSLQDSTRSREETVLCILGTSAPPVKILLISGSGLRFAEQFRV